MQAQIVLLPGDGIGPEVVAQGERVLVAVAKKFGHSFSFSTCPIGGCAIDQFGDPLPEQTLATCKSSDAILLGAVGGPKWDDPNAKTRPEVGLLKIRKELGLFANLRPISVSPHLISASPLKTDIVQGTDILFFRELTGGIYFGKSGKEATAEGETAYNTMIYSTHEIERIVRLAGQAARGRRKKVTSVDKANVLEVSRLWRKTFERVMKAEFPDVQIENVLVDAMAMHLISKPRSFDVVVTENLFGDILTDEGSMLPGSMGMLPSASIGS
ncbi:MAG: 3-isopropylmalate dehydrogenase, partial [Candidatus Saccharimonas sp.]|nr:3-isopropylmalate dehydrogenase [Planctomycetaceae bacterium]